MKKLLTAFSFLIILLTVYATNVMAADLVVTFNDDACVISPTDGKLFDQMNMAPAQTITRTLEVKNEGVENANLSLKMTNYQESGLLDLMATVLHLKVIEQGTGTVVSDNKTIADWKDKSLVLPEVQGHTSKTYEFQVTLENVGNNYQNKKLSFDIEMQCNQSIQEGDVMGDSDTRSPGVVIGQFISRLPETGQNILTILLGLSCIGLGFFLKKKISHKSSPKSY